MISTPDHYASAYQVWDLAAAYRLDFFQGNIIKYLVRHEKKGGRADLEKAAHYCERYAEIAVPKLLEDKQPFDRFVEANDVGLSEGLAILHVLCGHPDVAVSRIEKLIARRYP